MQPAAGSLTRHSCAADGPLASAVPDLWQESEQMRATVAALRDELAALKSASALPLCEYPEYPL